MWINETKLVFAPESLDEVTRFLLGRPMEIALAHPDFQFTFLLNSLETPGACRSFTIWRDGAAGEAFFASDEYRGIVGGLAAKFLETPQRQDYDELYLDVGRMPAGVSEVWVNISDLKFKAADLPAVKEHLLGEALTFVRQWPGYLFNYVLNARSAPGELASISMFANAETGQALLGSDEYRAVVKDVAHWLQAPPTRSQYSVLYLETRALPETARMA